MGILSKALPRDQQQSQQGPSVKSDYGMYNGFFIGMTEPTEWVTTFKDICRLCKGSGTGKNGSGECSRCHGTGLRTEEHTKLRYALENGIIEEEEVNFTLSAPGTGRDGTPLSPSTLFQRLRTISGIQNATEAQLDEWYTALRAAGAIKVPIQVVIADNKTGTALKITNVLAARQPRERAFTPADAKKLGIDVPDDDEFAGLEKPPF